MKSKLLLGMLFASLAAAAPAAAAPFTFATFTEVTADQPLHFTNFSNSGYLSTPSLGFTFVPVLFAFTSPTGLSTTVHNATLRIMQPSFVSTFTPASSLGSLTDQPLDVPDSLTIFDNDTGNLLLSMFFTGDIVGRTNGPTADITGATSTGQTVAFSSDFLAFQPTSTSNSYTLGLSNLSPNLSIGPGGFLNSFTSDLDGLFVADFTTPEPTTLSLTTLTLAALLTKRPRK